LWPFQRKAEAEPDRGSDGRPQPVPAPITRSDWKRLAPMQRAVGGHPLTAHIESFAGELATHRDPSVVSRSLGHHVSAEAPAGLVLGVALPTTRQDGPAMVPRPRVQRRAATAEGVDDRDVTAMASLDGGAFVTREIPQPAAPRELPVVAAEPSVQRLTTVARDAAPMPVGAGRAVSGPLGSVLEPVGHHEAIGPIGNDPVDQPLTSGPARLTLGQSRRLGLGAPLRQVPSSSVQRAAVDAAPELTLASHHREPEQPPVLRAGQTEEILVTSPAATAVPALGLERAMTPGAQDEPTRPPLSGVSTPGPRLDLPLAPGTPPSVPAVQRAASEDGPPAEPTEAPATLATPTASTIEPAERPVGPLGALPPSDRPADFAGSAPMTRSSSGPLPLVQRRTIAPTAGVPPVALAPRAPMSTMQRAPIHTESSPGSEGPGPAMTTASTAPAAPLASLAPIAPQAPLAPLVGSRSLSRAAASQRATEPAPAALHEPIGRAFDLDLSNARIDRSDEAARASTSVQALAFTRGDTIALPSTHGSMQSGRGRSLLAHELTHVAQQRRHGGGAGSALPGEDSPAGEHLELQARAVEQQAAQDMPLAPVASVASVQRATAIAESAAAVASAPSFSIQRDPESAPAPASSSSGGPANAPAPGAAAGTASSSSPTHADHEQDMDELAGKLYDRIRGRLKSELLVDRERAGLLTDLR
jgi:Domain of unknown function (DUF4157)